jgi:hypothetical protein
VGGGIRGWSAERGREGETGRRGGEKIEGRRGTGEAEANSTLGNKNGESDSRSQREGKKKKKDAALLTKVFLCGNTAARVIRGSGA